MSNKVNPNDAPAGMYAVIANPKSQTECVGCWYEQASRCPGKCAPDDREDEQSVIYLRKEV